MASVVARVVQTAVALPDGQRQLTSTELAELLFQYISDTLPQVWFVMGHVAMDLRDAETNELPSAAKEMFADACDAAPAVVCENFMKVRRAYLVQVRRQLVHVKAKVDLASVSVFVCAKSANVLWPEAVQSPTPDNIQTPNVSCWS